MISTSYRKDGYEEIISGLTKIYNPKIVVELGTQQGGSAIIIAKALLDGHLYTYDLFEPTYKLAPYKPTKASLKITKQNIAKHKLSKKITVCQKDALSAYQDFKSVDMLHVDLCNHYDNVEAVLAKWHAKVKKLILLEGGVNNSWQKKYGFKPFNGLLERLPIKELYRYIIISGDSHYGLTVLIRK